VRVDRSQFEAVFGIAAKEQLENHMGHGKQILLILEVLGRGASVP